MKENSVKNIHDEMVYYNAKMHATMGEAYRAYEKFSLMYSANENPFHGFHTQSEFFMNASGISAEDPSVIFNECKKIHDKVDDTQYCGYVIDFVNKKHMGMGKEYPFGSCLIKISAEGVDIPYYILADESTLFNSRVFIGEDYKAYLVTQLNKDEFKCLKLKDHSFRLHRYNI